MLGPLGVRGYRWRVYGAQRRICTAMHGWKILVETVASGAATAPAAGVVCRGIAIRNPILAYRMSAF